MYLQWVCFPSFVTLPFSRTPSLNQHPYLWWVTLPPARLAEPRMATCFKLALPASLTQEWELRLWNRIALFHHGTEKAGKKHLCGEGKMNLTFIETSAMTSKWLPSHLFQSLLLCWQGRHITICQKLASVAAVMVFTHMCQFCECTEMPWILQNTLRLHFWKWLYSHSLLFWLNPSRLT